MNPHSLHLRARLRGVRQTLLHLAAACEGVEAIEFAIILPVLLLFVLGCVEFGRLYWTQTELQNAVEAAARCVTVSCPTGTKPIYGKGSGTYAADRVYGITVPDATVFSLTSPSPACGNQVTVCYPFTFIVPTLFPFTNATPPLCPANYTPPAQGLTLTATGCHQA